jgi:aminoglycoside phosphotransferase (APT) family kinase protein
MVLAAQRDLQETGFVLARWLATKLDAADVRLFGITTPNSNGLSNETILTEAEWTVGGEMHRQGLVFRIKPHRSQLFLHDNFRRQYDVLRIIQRHGVPAPRGLWYEEDPTPLGQPFFVMNRIYGEVPGDSPPYWTAGFWFEASRERRRVMWNSAVDALATLHNARLTAQELSILDEPQLGPTGLNQDFERAWRYFLWATEGRENPIVERVFDHLRATFPKNPTTSIAWGDCRIGNMIFSCDRCVAILDWEQVSSAGPLADVGWWMAGGRMTNYPLKGEGMGSNAEFLERWHARTGIEPEGLDWYELYAVLRVAIIYIRFVRLYEKTGVWIMGSNVPWTASFERDNAITQIAQSLMD